MVYNPLDNACTILGAVSIVSIILDIQLYRTAATDQLDASYFTAALLIGLPLNTISFVGSIYCLSQVHEPISESAEY